MALTQVSSGLLANTGVTAATYGGATQHTVVSINSEGQVTYAANVSPSIANTQITGLITSAQIANVANTQITGNITASQITSVANTQITGNITSSQIAASGVTAGTYGGSATVPSIVVNTQGQITSSSNTSIAIGTSAITSGTLSIARGGTNATCTPTSGGVAYGTGSAIGYTAAGTSGYYLKSNGSSAPTWASVCAAPPTSYNAVGSYVIASVKLGVCSAVKTIPAGTTVAAGCLRYIYINASTSLRTSYSFLGGIGTSCAQYFSRNNICGSNSISACLSGTWRSMSYINAWSFNTCYAIPSIFVRVS